MTAITASARRPSMSGRYAGARERPGAGFTSVSGSSRAMRLLPAQLDLQIVDHTLYAGNASAEAYGISQIPVIENDAVQRGNSIRDGDEHVRTVEIQICSQGRFYLYCEARIGRRVRRPFPSHHDFVEPPVG